MWLMSVIPTPAGQRHCMFNAWLTYMMSFCKLGLHIMILSKSKTTKQPTNKHIRKKPKQNTQLWPTKTHVYIRISSLACKLCRSVPLRQRPELLSAITALYIHT